MKRVLLALSLLACQRTTPATEASTPVPSESPPVVSKAPAMPGDSPHPNEEAKEETKEDSNEDPTAVRRFGRPLREGTREVALHQLLASPEAYAGQTIRTQGTVARVCKAMGCWMELQVPDGPATLRAPMAGHAFFLPQDVVGQSAVVEGKIQVRSLSQEQKDHYRAEGMEAVDVAASLDAEAVQVAGS